MNTSHLNPFRRAFDTNLAVCFGLGILSALLAGCGPAEQTPAAPAQDKVVIKGSNTVGEELAPRLIAEYKKDHPKVAIDLECKGSGSGFWGLIAGMCDVAASSRTMLKDEQQQAQVHGIELNDYTIGSYSVAVIVNANDPLKDLTREQIRDIFIGTLGNWKALGGPDASIHLYIRNPISGTYLGFRELGLEDKPYTTNNVTELTSYAAIVEAVSKDPNGIGYASLDLASKPGVKALSVGGVAPTAASVKEGKYPFTRVLHFYTNKGQESPLTHDFIQFVQSSRGQEIVAQMGFVPKP